MVSKRKFVNVTFLAAFVTRDIFELSQTSFQYIEQKDRKEDEIYLVQVIQTLPNNLDGFLEIILRNDQRWSKADTKIAISLDPNTLCSHLHVNMCWLGQQTSTLQQQAKLPSRPPLQALRFVDNYSIQEATPTDSLD